MSALPSGVPNGFDFDDERQEAALGMHLAGLRKPGDAWAAHSRAKVRVARHRNRERQWNSIKIPIYDHDRGVMGLQFEQALIHEIMDLLPYSYREDALKGLLSGDGRVLRKVKRLLEDKAPGITDETL
jgi:hypothetical protein